MSTDFWIRLAAIVVPSGLAVLGIVTHTRDERTHALTSWGVVSLGLVLCSLLLGTILHFGEWAQREKERSQAQQAQLQEAKQTLERYERTLVEMARLAHPLRNIRISSFVEVPWAETRLDGMRQEIRRRIAAIESRNGQSGDPIAGVTRMRDPILYASFMEREGWYEIDAALESGQWGSHENDMRWLAVALGHLSPSLEFYSKSSEKEALRIMNEASRQGMPGALASFGCASLYPFKHDFERTTRHCPYAIFVDANVQRIRVYFPLHSLSEERSWARDQAVTSMMDFSELRPLVRFPLGTEGTDAPSLLHARLRTRASLVSFDLVTDGGTAVFYPKWMKPAREKAGGTYYVAQMTSARDGVPRMSLTAFTKVD